MDRQGAVGVGAVGLVPGQTPGLLSTMPRGDLFQLVAYSDEGTEGHVAQEPPVTCYRDYNVLLRDPTVELVFVGGPVELRRDLAVRALNAGRHVVLQAPFCESALDAERLMKTAFQQGLIATMQMSWRDEPDFRALRVALAEENAGMVHSLQAFWWPPEPDQKPTALLETVAFALLDQINLLVGRDGRDVSAYPLRPAPGRPDVGFTLVLPLRREGCAIARAGHRADERLPRWVVDTRGTTIVAGGRQAVALAGDQRRVYDAPVEAEGFWVNLHAAVRHGADLKCATRDIVRAMKLHEAALESAGLGEPVPV